MPSTSKLSGKSPISSVPDDILQEIFVHCLPQHPLNERQPNTKIAPMLLCQVCSSWRTVALASAALWSHLFFRLTEGEGYMHFPWAIDGDEYRFLHWWKKNQGSIAPFLRLELQPSYTGNEMAEDDLEFLMEYIMSAQYLKLDIFYWRQMQHWINLEENDEESVDFPYLHTLVKFGNHFNRERYIPILMDFAEEFTSEASVLRRLAIHYDALWEDRDIPIHWSSLTHILLDDVHISLAFWFSAIRTLPNLQWGYFDVETLTGINNYTKPTIYTHSKLSTLFLAVRDVLPGHLDDIGFSALFTHLHLPALRTLSLSAHQAWYDPFRSPIAELYDILSAAPAITSLTLGDTFLGYKAETLRDVEGGKEPIWSRAKHLEHLQFEFSNSDDDKDEWEAAEEVDTLIRNIFFSDSAWLDLKNTAYPARSVAIIDKLPANEPVFDLIREHAMADARNNVAPNVVVQIASESVHQPSANAWKEWDLGI